MTTDPRKAAIEAMAWAIIPHGIDNLDEDAKRRAFERALPYATAAFDAQHGIVRVVPPEATCEMLGWFDRSFFGGIDRKIYAANAAGDLTRKPE